MSQYQYQNPLQYQPQYLSANQNPLSNPNPLQQDELTAAVFGAVESLSAVRKAGFLLENALELIEAGK